MPKTELLFDFSAKNRYNDIGKENKERLIKMTALKPKEQRVLDYLKENIAKKGYAPSVREICQDLNIKSTSTAHMYIERLANKGYIIRQNGKSRTIILPQEETETISNCYNVPILGQVAAGTPILTAENFDGYVAFSTERSYDADSLFALKIKGRSMVNVGIMDGDLVVVEKRSYADNGEIVVAMIDDEATVKRFFKENGTYRLQPENSEMDPIIADEVSILGKVVADIRFY